MHDGSWLFRDGTDRERMLDMDRRLQPVRRSAFGVLAIALLACGPWLGWWTIAPLLLAAAIFRLADSRIERVKRPEYAMFAAWAVSQVIIAGSVALTGGPRTATMAWFAIPIVTLSARFSTRGIGIGVAVTLALQAAVAFGVDAAAVVANPPLLIVPAAAVIAVAILSTALMRSDREHRSEAVIDQLTGMLNRKALTPRANELQQQSQVSGEPIGLILGDLDHFKRVNDTRGHACGDGVLKDVAYVLRKELRAFDLVYRLGGEEFLVLLPGADVAQAEAVAESLREAVARGPLGGEDMTMSFGVSASRHGDPFEYEAVFAAADLALYDAKRKGRDRVCVAGPSSDLVPA
jgi:diguanylate cyclase (GGDEF)-like protein